MAKKPRRPSRWTERQWTALRDRIKPKFFPYGEGFAAFLKTLLSYPDEQVEMLLCALDGQYFVETYCKIYDPQANDWIPFHLWDAQRNVLRVFESNRLVIVLKARQLGLSWLALAYALWLMLFAPVAVILLFSRRDDESVYLLGEERLKGMYRQLPQWMQAESVLVDSAHQFKLSNESIAYAFPTSAGDSYTASLVIVDEADLIPDLNRLMRSVKPTIAAGGRLLLISRANKDLPHSPFKGIYRAAKAQLNGWAHVFLPWHVRPGYTPDWYERQKAEILERTGSLDELKEQYPATDEEALSAVSLNKRIPAEWLEACYEERPPLPASILPPGITALPNVRIWKLPEPGRRYTIGMDCAEGLRTSDDSVTEIIDRVSGEQVANLCGKHSPAMHAAYTAALSDWYNKAPIMPENNNHGHSAILWFNDNGYRGRVLEGHNKKPGWTSSTLGKVLLYDTAAEAAREAEFLCHDYATWVQLGSIEKNTLLAPPGEHDDRADAFALALVAARMSAGDMPVMLQADVKW